MGFVRQVLLHKKKTQVRGPLDIAFVSPMKSVGACNMSQYVYAAAERKQELEGMQAWIM